MESSIRMNCSGCKAGVSSQLPLIASSQSSSAECSSGIAATFSLSGSPTSLSDTASSGVWSGVADDQDADWCLETGRSRGRGKRGKRSRRIAQLQQNGRSGGAIVAKKQLKNAREKERVKNVREQYEGLGVLLGERVERGSGHFSKVRTLAAAIRRIEDLWRGVPDALPSQTVEHLQAACLEPSPPPPPQLQPAVINLSCEERLEPALQPYTETPNSSFETLFPEEITPTYPTTEDLPPAYTPYFSYSSGAEFPPIGNATLFPCSPDLTLPPPSSTLVFSPELTGHVTHPGGAIPTSIGTLSPLGVPSTAQTYHAGSDIWLAIGCN